FRDPAVLADRRALQAMTDEVLRDDGTRLGELSPQLLYVLTAQMGDGAEALPLLRAAQRRYASDFWLSFRLGNILYGAGRTEEAAAYYRVAVALRPEVAAVHNNLGNALRAKRDVDGAIAEFRTAIALDPKIGAIHFNLGTALSDKPDLKGAISEYK